MSIFNPESPLMRKNDLWFLQTHLTMKELRYVFERWVEFYRNNFNIRRIIESVVSSRTRQIDLCNKLENNKSAACMDTRSLLSVFEVALLTKKRYSQGFPLALHFTGNPSVLKSPVVASLKKEEALPFEGCRWVCCTMSGAAGDLMGDIVDRYRTPPRNFLSSKKFGA